MPLFENESSCKNEFDLHERELLKGGGGPFSYQWFHAKTRFDTEAKGNSEMVYWFFRLKIPLFF